AVYDERVASIMAALKTHDDVGLLGEPIDNLALAFVPPLGSDDHHIRHGAPVDSRLSTGGWQPSRFAPAPPYGGVQHRCKLFLKALPPQGPSPRCPHSFFIG